MGYFLILEGTACAEVLLAGEQGGSKSTVVFAGLGIAAVYKFIADGLKLFPSEFNFSMQGSIQHPLVWMFYQH